MQKAHKKQVLGEKQTKVFEAFKEALSREPVLACFDLGPVYMEVGDPR